MLILKVEEKKIENKINKLLNQTLKECINQSDGLMISYDFNSKICIVVNEYNTLSLNNKIKESLDKQCVYGVEKNTSLENIIIYSFKEIYSTLINPPFKNTKGYFIIDHICNNITDSINYRARLLLNIFTYNSKLLLGNKHTYNYLKKCSWDVILKVFFSYHCNQWLEINQIVEYLIKDPYTGISEKNYLGYLYKGKVNLYQQLSQYILIYVNEKKMIKLNNKYRFNEEWLRKFELRQENDYDKKLIKNQYYDFSETGNLFGPPKGCLKVLKNYTKFIPRYPDYKFKSIKKILEKALNVGSDNIAITPGSIEPLIFLPRLLKLNKVSIVNSFYAYALAFEKININFNKIEVIDFNKKRIYYEIKKAAKSSSILYICRPDKICFLDFSKEDIINMVVQNPHCHFLIDETYTFFSKKFESETISSEVNKYKNLSCVISISKFFNIAGIRTGIILSNADIIKKYENYVPPYTVSHLSQMILEDVLQDKNFIVSSRIEIENSYKLLKNELSKFKWINVYSDDKVPFLYCELRDNIKAEELTLFLMHEYNIIIKNMKNSGIKLERELIRITCNTFNLNNLLIKALKEFERTHTNNVKDNNFEIINKLINDIKLTFENKRIMVLIYGSSVYGHIYNDLDICVFTDSYTEGQKNKLKEIIINFHKNNELILDNEISYDNKLIFSLNDIENLFKYPPFPIYNNRFYIEKVVKNKRFLESTNMKKRLLLNILTTNHILLCGDKDVLERYKLSAWELLTKVIFSYLNNKCVTIEEFIDSICEDPFFKNEGELYLGYKREYQYKYLLNTITHVFEIFLKDGLLQKTGGDKYCISKYNIVKEE